MVPDELLGIDPRSDGKLWFADLDANAIGHLTPSQRASERYGSLCGKRRGGVERTLRV